MESPVGSSADVEISRRGQTALSSTHSFTTIAQPFPGKFHSTSAI